MAKTLNHYSQQIKALAPDALVLDRARELGALLLEAKAAVQAADRKWTDWLKSDCSLTARTAQRFMTVARRWDEPAFTEARQQRPDLPLREADKVLAANSGRKRPEPETPDPYNLAMGKLAVARWELQLASEIRQVDEWAGAELHAAQEALAAVQRALMNRAHGPGVSAAWDGHFEPAPRRTELRVGDRCCCRVDGGHEQAGQIVSVLPAPDGGWSTYSWRQDGTDQEAVVGWGLPGAASGISHSIAALLQPIASDRLKSTDAAGSPEQA
jgi:hypothetical protein